MPNFLWTQKQDIGPKPRRAHAMAYDANRGRSILFGGASTSDQLFNDTWEWDGQLWTQTADMGPSSRCNHAMAYDSNRQRAIIFGGIAGSQRLGDTWEWDGENWTQVSNSGPTNRSGHTMVYNSKTKRTILFGGESSSGVLNDTWEFDGENWVQLEDTGPSPRKLHSMTYDSFRDRIVLFGGTSNSAGLNDTWEWNGENWTQVSDFGPPPCLSASMVYMNSIVALFGGVSSIGTTPLVAFDNTWGWDGHHWTQYQDIGPSQRWGQAAVFDTKRTSLMLFGGIAIANDSGGAAQAENLLGDTWEYQDTSQPLEPIDPNDPAGPNAPNAPNNPINPGNVFPGGILSIVVVPDSVRVSLLNTVSVTVNMDGIINVTKLVNLFFVRDTDIATGNPPDPTRFILLGPLQISPGQSSGIRNLGGVPITESGFIVAEMNGATQQAHLTITGP